MQVHILEFFNMLYLRNVNNFFIKNICITKRYICRKVKDLIIDVVLMVHLVEFFKKKFSHERYQKDLEAVKMEQNPKKLADFACNNVFSNVRLEAVNRIDDEHVLGDVARNDSNRKVRMAAIGKIRDKSVLEDISRNDSNRSVRNFAENRLIEFGWK